MPGRMQRIDQGQPFGVIVDYAHTDDALHNVLTTLREMTQGRLLLAFGCGGNRDAGKRPKMGQVAARLAAAQEACDREVFVQSYATPPRMIVFGAIAIAVRTPTIRRTNMDQASCG